MITFTFQYWLLLALSVASVQGLQGVQSWKDSLCNPTTYIVLGGNEVAIYDPSLHGEGVHLRLFEQYPSSCGQTRKLTFNSSELSPRTDIQARSTTDLVDRGIFSWALSKIFWAGVAGVTGGLFGAISCGIELARSGFTAGNLACVATSVFTVVGGGFGVWDEIAKSLGSATQAAAATEVFEMTGSAFTSSAETFFTAHTSKRKRDNSSDLLDSLWEKHQARTRPSELFRAQDHEPVYWYHLLLANETNPVSLYHHGKFTKNLNATINVWSTYNSTTRTVRMHHAMPLTPANGFNTTIQKRNCNAGSSTHYLTETEGQLDLCYSNDGPDNDGAPTQAYFGYDLYGEKWAEQEWSDDIGTAYDSSNGFEDALFDMSEDINSHNWWETCVCAQTQSSWVATGSFQYSWDGVYNGYSPCWNANCDGANVA